MPGTANEPFLPVKVEYSKDGLAVPKLAIYLVYLTIFLDSIAATISTPALPYYAREFGANDADIGYLFAIWSFNATFCAPLLGRISDKVGRHKILAVSLAGAGIANIGQASAPSYWILFCWRGFSGMWASVAALAQVYLADVCDPKVLNVYMSWLAAIPGLAMTFGPGIGGLLSVLGLNVPILVDGVISLIAAGVVYVLLPESPVWEQSCREGSKRSTTPQTAVPLGAVVVGLSGLLWGEAFGTRVSMTVVALNAKLGFNAVQVGAVYGVFALASVFQTIWATPRLMEYFGTWGVAIWGTLVMGVAYKAAFSWCVGVGPCLTVLLIASCGNSFRQAASGPISAEFADTTNRGSVFAQVQMMTNLGRLLGPLIAGNLALIDPITWPWTVACISCLLSSLLLGVLKFRRNMEGPADCPESVARTPSPGLLDAERLETPDPARQRLNSLQCERGDSSWSISSVGRTDTH
mmetsp:Transcript_54524/g.100903  ORF Transcript_54524/g.100903 Transcript_54524/m.100903 type:complete len:466 (-) Transcript_54524:52-1449(-)